MIQNPLAISKETGEIIHISDIKSKKHNEEFICPNCHSPMIGELPTTYASLRSGGFLVNSSNLPSLPKL